MLPFLLWTIPVFIGLKIYQKYTCGICMCNTDMKNKVVIVTGANTGIGYETAKDLARRGAKVILACRNEEKGNEAKEKIVKETSNKNVELKLLDLTSFKSIKRFAQEVLRTEPKLHVLVNNAGTGKLDNSLTEDRLPIETQINYFGPFLLTTLLLPLLKSSAPSRIINVSSVLHKFGTINTYFEKPAQTSLQHIRVYSNTKLGNVLFTRKLSQILQDTGVTANSLHPGAVYTDIFRNRSWFTKFLIRLAFKTSWEGAQTSIHLAVSDELDNVSGKYFADCREAKTSNQALDDVLADKLWNMSQLVLEERKML